MFHSGLYFTCVKNIEASKDFSCLCLSNCIEEQNEVINAVILSGFDF